MMGASLSAMPTVAVAARAYGHWYVEGQLKQPRLGVPASVIWRSGLDAVSPRDLQSATALVCAFALVSERARR
jgi:hypothetical protein